LDIYQLPFIIELIQPDLNEQRISEEEYKKNCPKKKLYQKVKTSAYLGVH